MSVAVQFTVWCDHDDCFAWIWVDGETRAKARRNAQAANGWFVGSLPTQGSNVRVVELCPAHHPDKEERE